MRQYLVAREDMNLVRKVGEYLAHARWWDFSKSPAFIVPAAITYLVTLIGSCIAGGYNLWSEHPVRDHTSWWLVSLGLAWFPAVLASGYGSVLYFKRRALQVPRNESAGYYMDENEKKQEARSNLILEGANAYDRMPAILKEGAGPIYDRMYDALARYHIANEPLALQAAAKRGQLLKDIVNEGVMTRAAQIDIKNEDDLKQGRGIVQEMQIMRREIES